GAPRGATLTTGRSALRELRSLARLVQAGLLALDLARVTGQEAGALQWNAQLRVGFHERAGDSVPDGPRLARGPAAVDANADVVRPLGLGDLQRREHGRAQDFLRPPVELLAQRAAADASRIAGVAVVALLVEFVARDPDLLGVDDDHEISRVDVWRELRLALAAKRVRDPGGQTAERL